MALINPRVLTAFFATQAPKIVKAAGRAIDKYGDADGVPELSDIKEIIVKVIDHIF